MKKRAEGDSRTMFVGLVLALILIVILFLSITYFFGYRAFPFARYLPWFNQTDQTEYIKIIGFDKALASLQIHDGNSWIPLTERDKIFEDTKIISPEIREQIYKFWFFGVGANTPRATLPVPLSNIPKTMFPLPYANQPKYGNTFTITEFNPGTNGKDNYVQISYEYYTSDAKGIPSGKLAPSYFKLTGDNKFLDRDPAALSDYNNIVYVGTLTKQTSGYQFSFTPPANIADLSQDSLNALNGINNLAFNKPPIPKGPSSQGNNEAPYFFGENNKYKLATISEQETNLPTIENGGHSIGTYREDNLYLRLYEDGKPLDVYFHAKRNNDGSIVYALEAVKHSVAPFKEITSPDTTQQEVYKQAMAWRDSLLVNPLELNVYDSKTTLLPKEQRIFCFLNYKDKIVADLDKPVSISTTCDPTP